MTTWQLLVLTIRDATAGGLIWLAVRAGSDDFVEIAGPHIAYGQKKYARWLREAHQ